MTTIDLCLSYIADVFGHLTVHDELSEHEISELERRLGIALPAALRRIYRRTGRHRMQEYGNQLIHPRDLRILNGVLRFCTEQQSATEWAIDEEHLALPDPPVVSRALDSEGAVYTPEFSSVSQFMCFLVAWKVADGALPAVGIRMPSSEGSVPPLELESVGESIVRNDYAEIWYRTGGVVLQQLDGYVVVGAQSREIFDAIVDRIGVSDWDFLSWRDA